MENDSNMSDPNDIDVEKIRERVEERFKERTEFFMHLVIYVIINAMLWGIYIFSGGGWPWPIVPMLGWGAGLFAHGVEVFAGSSFWIERRERAIQQEIERERMRRMGYFEKPKRERLRLSDDGELLSEQPPDEEEQPDQRYFK